jgi:hypothetical protein
MAAGEVVSAAGAGSAGFGLATSKYVPAAPSTSTTAPTANGNRHAEARWECD